MDMDKSKRKLILLLILLFLAFVSLLFQFYRHPISPIIIAITPFLITILPFLGEYIESFIEHSKKKKFIENTFNEIKDYLQKFFRFNLHNPLIDEDYISKEDIPKEDIYERFIKSNFEGISNIAIQSIILCFYCNKWEKLKSPEIYGEMQKYSKSIGLSFAKLTDDTKIFLNIYSAFKSNKKFNSLTGIIQDKKGDSEYLTILKNFAEKYVNDLSFFEIKDKLKQSENLRYTLIKIIKEGKLSNWGISNETLRKLEDDLQKRIDYSKVYLVLGNKIDGNIKDYLKAQPGLTGWAPFTRNIPYTGKFSGYIVKPKDRYKSAKKFIEKLKTLANEKEEKIIFVIPIDFLNCESYVLPNNQSFKSTNLKECFDAISWFRTGYEFSDTDLWNAISKSEITPDELLAVIPFNIFCEGILPCEQDFMIKNYDYIKEKCGINKLTDWMKYKDNPEVIADYLLEKGHPNYNSTEIKNVLGVKSKEEFDSGVRKRLLALCEQIVQHSEEFSKSLSLVYHET